jgi:hypothetical protein
MNTLPVIEQIRHWWSNIHYSRFTEGSKASWFFAWEESGLFHWVLKQLFLSVMRILYPLEFVFLQFRLLSSGKDFAIWFEGVTFN